MAEGEELGGPHLVLADLGADDRVGEHPADRLDDPVRGKAGARSGQLRGKGVLGLPGIQAGAPGIDVRSNEQWLEGLQHLAGIPHDRNLDRDVAGDRQGVLVHVDDPGPRGELRELSRGPVVEAHPHREQQVRMRDRHVRRIGAVHAQHAEAQGAVRGNRTGTHEGVDDRHPGLLDHFPQDFYGPGDVNPAAHVEQRLPRLGECLGRPLDLPGVSLGGGVVAPNGHRPGILGLTLFLEHVYRQIHQHRPGTSGGGDGEGLLDDPSEVAALEDEVVVLGDRPGDADDVRLLEGVVADHGPGHLSGEAHDRHRVEVGRGQTGHGVRGPRPAGDQADPGAAARAGIPVGGVHGPLLVACQNDLDPGFRVQGVEDRDHDAPGEAEQVGDSLFPQSLDEQLGASDVHRVSSFPYAAAGGSAPFGVPAAGHPEWHKKSRLPGRKTASPRLFSLAFTLPGSARGP